jgi:hypothetical protein
MAFSGCLLLKSICLPASLLVIDGTCFAESGIRRIEIEAGNPHFEAKDDFLIDLRERNRGK